MTNTYDIGDRVKITGTFKENGELGDPAVIRGIYKNSSIGLITTLLYSESEIVRESPGVYSFEIEITSGGYWYYRMDDGGENVASEGKFLVRKSNLL